MGELEEPLYFFIFYFGWLLAHFHKHEQITLFGLRQILLFFFLGGGGMSFSPITVLRIENTAKAEITIKSETNNQWSVTQTEHMRTHNCPSCVNDLKYSNDSETESVWCITKTVILLKKNKEKNIMDTGKVQQARMTSTPKNFCSRCFISLKNIKGTNNTVNLHKSLGLHLIQILTKKVKITFFSCPHTHFKFQLWFKWIECFSWSGQRSW